METENLQSLATSPTPSVDTAGEFCNKNAAATPAAPGEVAKVEESEVSLTGEKGDVVTHSEQHSEELHTSASGGLSETTSATLAAAGDADFSTVATVEIRSSEVQSAPTTAERAEEAIAIHSKGEGDGENAPQAGETAAVASSSARADETATDTISTECEISEGLVKEDEMAVQKVLKRFPWESVAQCSLRRQFLKNVVQDQRKRLNDRVDLEELELLSALYYNVKFLHCTYDRRLLERLKFFDPDICAGHNSQNARTKGGGAQEIITG